MTSAVQVHADFLCRALDHRQWSHDLRTRGEIHSNNRGPLVLERRLLGVTEQRKVDRRLLSCDMAPEEAAVDGLAR
jgi:hypothetical protein